MDPHDLLDQLPRRPDASPAPWFTHQVMERVRDERKTRPAAPSPFSIVALVLLVGASLAMVPVDGPLLALAAVIDQDLLLEGGILVGGLLLVLLILPLRRSP